MRRGAVCKLAATALKPAPRATPVLRTHAHPELASTTPTEYIAFPEFVTPNRIEGEEETLEEEGRPHDDGIPWSERTEKRSRAAQTGSSKLGMVELPTDLQLAVNVLVEGGDKALIRTRALDLYEHFRRTSAVQSTGSSRAASKRSRAAIMRVEEEEHEDGQVTTTAVVKTKQSKPFLDGHTALAYTAGVMPSVYGATLAVLREAKQRFDHMPGVASGWTPKQIVDWGAGVASGAWVAKRVWPDTPIAYVGLDSSRSMQSISSHLLTSIRSERFTTKLHQTSLGNPELHGLIDGSNPHIGREDTMAIAAYTLGDLPNDKVRREVVRSLWDSGAEVIVVIDRGTPQGFNIVATARDQLLRLGRHEHERALKRQQISGVADQATEEGEEDQELHIGNETFVAQQSSALTPEEAAANVARSGCHIIAPCPHDKECPMHKTKQFCRFSQKVQRPAFLRKTKHSSHNEESSSYSYFVLKRGQRPAGDEQWPRLVLPPLKRGGHVIMDACHPSGNLERCTVAKSAGKQEYYDARKSTWGDIFPHWDHDRSRARK